MNANDLIRRLRRLARRTGVLLTVDRSKGKGSHAMVTFGDRRATVPMHSADLPRGTLRAILIQLGVDEAAL